MFKRDNPSKFLIGNPRRCKCKRLLMYQNIPLPVFDVLKIQHFKIIPFPKLTWLKIYMKYCYVR